MAESGDYLRNAGTTSAKFAVDFLPWAAPHDKVDMVCGACTAAYWADWEADEGDYS